MAVLSSLRFSFIMKAAGILLLVFIAQWLFYGQEPGGTLGVFVLAWCAVLPVAAPALRRGAPAAFLAVAAVLALLLVGDPSPLGWARHCQTYEAGIQETLCRWTSLPSGLC